MLNYRRSYSLHEAVPALVDSTHAHVQIWECVNETDVPINANAYSLRTTVSTPGQLRDRNQKRMQPCTVIPDGRVLWLMRRAQSATQFNATRSVVVKSAETANATTE